ncbi:MAG: endonuclease [Bacteroidetes bacterium]|nr:MAG: endonuclease [Bacteroidota bacterium]
MKRFLLLLLPFLLLLNACHRSPSQGEGACQTACIAFYNLENLFDTINQEQVNDGSFTPEGNKAWGSQRYWEKSHNMAKVIAEIATDVTPEGPIILGVSEVENREVLEDLVKDELIRKRNYRIVHYDSPDRRGIDVALLYNPNYFQVTDSQARPLHVKGKKGFRTRDQLVVSGLLDGEPMHFIVVHWPSRYGGEEKSRPLRNAAAQLSRSIIDSLTTLDPQAKIVLMGDYNDDPDNESVTKYLNASGKKRLHKGQLYNPFEQLFRKGIGSLAYRGHWNMFDQQVITRALLKGGRRGYRYHDAVVFQQPWMKQKEAPYEGYPLRTFAGGRYLGGYSDHFPSYILLTKKAK